MYCASLYWKYIETIGCISNYLYPFSPYALPAFRHSHSFSRNTEDRKSTRLNSSHQIISYAVFCLKKKKRMKEIARQTRATTAVVTLHLTTYMLQTVVRHLAPTTF